MNDLTVYLLFEAVIFVAIKIGQYALTREITRFIMYAAIVGNTVMAVWLYRRYGKSASDKRDHLIFCALCVNCVADIFLTLISGPTVYIPGFACFCTVEAIYAAYLRPDTRNLVIRAALFVASLLFARAINLLTLPNALGLLNLTLLGANVVCAWLARRRERTFASLLFAVGLSSFFIGDISVALEIMLPAGTVAQRMVTLAVWTFYVPAQLLIVLTYREKLRPAEAKIAS
ncbi:MAG: hypothetical protein IJK52_12980 [Oscillospiraceae bacterium]|nr:hypothetical protein [Oscillospiraceae bacterium]